MWSASFDNAAATNGPVSQTITLNDRIRPSADPQTGRRCHRPSLSGSEPGRRPWPLTDRTQMTADVIEHRQDFLFRKLLHQPEQFLALRAHDPNVSRQGPTCLVSLRQASVRPRGKLSRRMGREQSMRISTGRREPPGEARPPRPRRDTLDRPEIRWPFSASDYPASPGTGQGRFKESARRRFGGLLGFAWPGQFEPVRDQLLEAAPCGR